MSDTPFLQDAVEGMLDTLSTPAGLTVTFCRGESSAEVTAIPARTQTEGQEENGALVIGQVHDWIVKRSDLVLSGKVVTPAEGDRITDTHGGETFSYEVQLVDSQFYHWVGRFYTHYRIHTRLVSIEPVVEDEEGGE